MVTQNRHFCAKSIENSRKQVKIACFRLFLVEVTGLEPAISSSRTMRDTTFATPRNGKIIRFFVSGQTCGQTENLRTFKTSGEPKSQCFQGLSALLENSTPSVVIESRTMRDTTFATPRNGKNIEFICKWSNMWSDREIDDFSTFGRAEKVSVCGGFRHFSKILRRAW